MKLLACILFYLVMIFCEKPYQTWQTAVKSKIKRLQQQDTKSQILLDRFLDEYT